jgi:hypothetical protein
LLALALLLAGCGGTKTPDSGDATKTATAERKSPGATAKEAKTDEAKKTGAVSSAKTSKPAAKEVAKTAAPPKFTLIEVADKQPGVAPPQPTGETADDTIAAVGETTGDHAHSASRFAPKLPRMKVDDAKVAAAGIRKLAGKHITLYTDLKPSPEVDGLPAVFDLAFAQWCAFFGLDPVKYADWRMSGFLMQDKARFRQAGLLPPHVPAALPGYSINHELWLNEQPSDYYRRHLFLHEGTHGFMNTLLGGCGPTWYMEGLAELLGTHRWHEGRLTLGYMPANRDEVPYWGRSKLVKDAAEAGRARPLKEVVELALTSTNQVEGYAWSWAAAVFLDHHPQYQKRFRSLEKYILDGTVTREFYRLFAADWPQMCEEWQLFIAGMEYGYDLGRTAIDFAPGKPLPADGASVTIAADRGWQNAGVRLEAGAKYALRASGRYQVADKPQPWPCEPGGVSIRYYQGRPLGMLLAAVRPDKPEPDAPSALLKPIEVGLGTTLTPERSGTLFFKINDSAGELADNAGELKVEVKRQ